MSTAPSELDREKLRHEFGKDYHRWYLDWFAAILLGLIALGSLIVVIYPSETSFVQTADGKS